MAATPSLSVVVPSHDRPLRLRWLLNALEAQTLARDRWEVVVGTDSSGPETEALLREHPLAHDGTLRHVSLEPGTAPPGRNRNAAWRLARAPLVLFTDDDCRPPEGWLESALAAASRHPDAIVQGMTLPDPDEVAMRHGPYHRTQSIRPPVPWAEACNILYPRGVLESAEGFDETRQTGEDTDLAIRARAAGTAYAGDPQMLTYHAVFDDSLTRALRAAARWHDLPWLLKRHPQFRGEFPLWIFWKRTHVWLPLALFGAVRARRGGSWLVLALPWLLHGAPHHGANPRGRLRSLLELPGRALVDATEMIALVRGSIRHRTLFL